MKKIDLSELKSIVRSVLEEERLTELDASPPPVPGRRPGTPPPLPAAANKNAPSAPSQKPASAALPQKGALNKFKADVNMAVDAANRVKQNVEQANTKEALRWLDKMIQFATSAKSSLGTK